ncbi:DMT family transporter [Limimaricola pyoseonensis]|uniref:EamA domain-containing membrane protein RarD n=1 Tax=Limimaricola pyoseonensis TaxID=521013 RepID=A0A1G7KE99_9RHOB|nr:DMT family transporter [Limimaricola pyoseonensis]SDF35598.1 EamA domain-containing membrane protein RarD [Limimaricola pyoseonensis]
MIRPRSRRPVAPPRHGPTGETGAGIALMVLAMALLPVGDTLSKLLTREIAAIEVVAWRLAMQMLVMLALAAFLRHRLRGRAFSPVLAASGLCSVVSLGCLVGAFATMPIATAIAIFFVEPLVLVLLAGPLLGERIGPRRYAAVGVGFIGALVVIRPGFAGFTPAALLPLGAAVGYALNVIIMRSAARTRSALTIQLGATIYGAVLAAGLVGALAATGLLDVRAFAAAGWIWALIPAAGMVSAATFLLIAEAFRRSEAGLLAPFQYLEIVGATLLGFVVFGDLPDLVTVAGTAIILASGAYVVHRERVAGRGEDRATEAGQSLEAQG